MHIPDGFVSPKTYGLAYAAMVPFWAIASNRLKKTLSRKQVPLIALGAAFCFVVMFLNIPVFGRLTAHPVGAALVAIVCGPWAACLAISAALLVQAIPFGDGGVTTFGVNCLNLAVIAPFVGYWAFNLVRGKKIKPGRTALASAAAGYFSIIAAAAAVGIEMGIQPLIAHGQYLPYSLSITMPAMLLPHLFIIGPIEGGITAAAVAYLYKREPWLATENIGAQWSLIKRLMVTLIITAILAPLGIILPKLFGAGDAWGEWGPDKLKQMLGYVPRGIEHGSKTWHAPISDYALKGHEPTSVTIVLMAIIGALVTTGLCYVIGKILFRGGRDATT